MEIEVLGRGCHACEETARNTERAVRELGWETVVVRRRKLADVAHSDYPRPPALAIDGRLIYSGRTLGVREIKHWLRQGGAAVCAA